MRFLENTRPMGRILATIGGYEVAKAAGQFLYHDLVLQYAPSSSVSETLNASLGAGAVALILGTLLYRPGAR